MGVHDFNQPLPAHDVKAGVCMTTGKPLVIVGASGHGREVLDIVEAINHQIGVTWDCRGFLDDNSPPAELLDALGVHWLGTSSDASEWRGCFYVIGIGNGLVRERLSALCERGGLVPAVLIHPMASVGRHNVIGPGTVVGAMSTVTTNVTLGRHVLINRNCAVGHDSVLDDFATIHPGGTVAGGVRLGACSTVGASAAVIQGVSVGAGAAIGAGAAVVRDVESGQTVVGVPAIPVESRRDPTTVRNV